MQTVQRYAIGVLLINGVIGVDCSRRWDDDVTVITSHRAYTSAITNNGLQARQPSDCDF